MTKVCSKCRRELDESAFYKRGPRLFSQCKECVNASTKERKREQRAAVVGEGPRLRRQESELVPSVYDLVYGRLYG